LLEQASSLLSAASEVRVTNRDFPQLPRMTLFG
jgi:hypothetical protein